MLISVNMAIVWGNILILVFAHFVVSQRHHHCGEPTKYPDKQLDKKYLHKLVFNDRDRVAYKCSLGYSQSGGSRISYCIGGSWTPLNMNCQKKKCNALGDIENGQYSQEGRSFGDKAIAMCNKGYVLRGERVRMCLEYGWNGTDPICEVSKIICSAPAVANRWIKPGERTQYTVQDTVTITCSEGFDLIGSSVVRCGPDGQWLNLPECRPYVINCSAPTVVNGRIHGSGVLYKPEDIVDISCSKGFDLIGSSVVTCGPDGQWQGLPECRPKRISATGKCGPVPSHPNFELRDRSPALKEYQSGSRIRYKCGIGHRRARGSDSIRCQGGRWTKLRLHCERKRCGSAGEISYGRFEYTGVSFGHSAKAVCQEGYELVGPQMRTCRDGGWDGRIPTCEPVHCPPPPEANAEMSDPIYHHVPFGHMVSYHCRTGSLIGAREIHCTQKGTWSAPPPECKDIACPHPNVSRGSRMRGFRSVYKFGNTVTITCAPGLRLIGQSFITCGPDGEWKPELPECKRWDRRFN